LHNMLENTVFRPRSSLGGEQREARSESGRKRPFFNSLGPVAKYVFIAAACLTGQTWLCSGDIVVVRGTVSCPNAAERSAAAAIAGRWERFLGEIGLKCGTVSDESFRASSLASAKVAVLPYNPNLSDSELSELRNFLARGGRLIVCYSSDADLAGTMGLKLGPYMASGRAGRWETCRFLQRAPPYVPERVRQPARNIRPPVPDGRSSWTVAAWEDSNGAVQPESACVGSQWGYWFSHVLPDDPDAGRTRQMIAAMIGSLDSGVWPAVGRRAGERAGTMDMFDSFDAARRWIVGNAQGAGPAGRARALLAEADMLHEALLRLAERGDYGAAMEMAGRLDAIVFDAHAAACSPGRSDEFRAVWSRPGAGPEASEWDRAAALLARTGFTDVFVYSLSPGLAWCVSGEVPVSPGVKGRGDPLDAAIRSCRARGLRIHAWISCFNLEGAGESMIADLRKNGRLQVGEKSESLPWLCPSQERNIVAIKDAARDLLRRYEVDGLHLDYIRYENNRVCCCARCRQAFEAALGRRISDWPGELFRGETRREYLAWRRRQIENLVRDISTFARRERPGIVISAAVFGKYPTCADSVGQDWAAWIRGGYLDLVCPMDYTQDMGRFDEYVALQERVAPGRVVAGIGVSARESRLNPAQVIEQIRIARRAGVKGFALFELNRNLMNEVLPRLVLGPTRRD